MPFSDLVPLAPSGCLCRVPVLSLSAAVSRCGLSGAAVPEPRGIASSPPVAPRALVARMVEGFMFPPCPPSVLPQNYFSFCGNLRGFIPLRQLFHSGGVDALRQLDSPSHSLAPPPRVFRHSGGLMPPLSVSHSRGLAVRVFLPAGNPHPFPSSRPMAASRTSCGCVLGYGVGSGAPAGRCVPWIIFRADSLRSPCRRHQQPSGLPQPPNGLSLFQCRLLCLLSTTIGAFVCTLLCASTDRAVLPPFLVVFPASQRVLCRSSPTACRC